jgi:ubiquinone/menaquinone biosynthesis C-methylase UbiE
MSHSDQGVVDASASDQSESRVLRHPHRYDLLVRCLYFGFEGRFRRWVARAGEVGPGDTVLDVGSGTGTLLNTIAAQVDGRARLHGLDASKEMIEFARRKSRRKGVTAEFRTGSALGLPYADGKFDVVFCTFVMHHLPEEMRPVALREMRRVLREGGRLVLADFGKPRFPVSVGWLLHAARHLIPHRHDVVDLRQLVETGFEEVRTDRSWSGAVAIWTGRHPGAGGGG